MFVLGGGQLPTIGSEVWNPATGAWSRGGGPVDARLGGQTATRLLDGRVLIVGGQTGTLGGETVPATPQQSRYLGPHDVVIQPSPGLWRCAAIVIRQRSYPTDAS